MIGTEVQAESAQTNVLFEPARLAALYNTGLMDSLPDEAFDRLTRLSSRLLRAPVALLSLVGTDRQFFKSAQGLSEPWATQRETPLTHSFCQLVVANQVPLHIGDARNDVRVQDNPTIAALGIVAYLGVPIADPETGHVLGSMCVIDHEPRTWTHEDLQTLFDFAAQVTSEIALRQLLAKANAAGQRLDEAQEVGRIGSWEFDIATGKITWSKELYRLLQFDPTQGEPDYAGLMQRYHPADVPMHNAVVAKATKDGTSYAFDIRAVMNDNTIRWLQATGRAARDASGKVVRLFGTLQDITERKTLEAEKEQLLTDALERADRDPLTDLWNHRTFHHRLRVESERSAKRGTSLAVVVLDMDNFKFFNDGYGHLVGDDVLCRVADALRECCQTGDTLARIGGDEFALLMPRQTEDEARRSVACVRERAQSLSFQPPDEATAVPLRLSVGATLFPKEAVTGADAVYLADKRAMADKGGPQAPTGEAEELREELRGEAEGFSMLDALVTAVDTKDRYTRLHSEDVMRLARHIGQSMGLPREELRLLMAAALVHDVGKIGVPARILRFPSPLSEDAHAALRQHPVLGEILVGAVPELAHTLPAVRHHHERWDGAGYPDGLAGTQIPLTARILAVADAFSALTTDRPYRQGKSAIEALTILHQGAGTQWDARCVAALANHFAKSSLQEIVFCSPASSEEAAMNVGNARPSSEKRHPVLRKA